MDNKLAKLQLLEAEVASCNLCPLGSTRNKTVFGDGAVDAKIMLIGEGPGEDEDNQGRPFVGAAGQLLDKMLDASGFSRDKHIYIGNIVKCRPPGNRVPTVDEKAFCLPYLLQQIEIIDPSIIVLLGATALQGLINPNLKIGAERGKWRIWEGYHVMPTYHPAALLRNSNLKPKSWNDFKLIIDKYRELVDKDHYSPNH